MADSVNLKVYGRLAFAQDLVKGDKDGRKSAKLLISKTDAPPAGCATLKELKDTIVFVAKEAFGEKVNLKTAKLGLNDGDNKISQKSGEPYKGYPGNWELGISTRFDFAAVTKVGGNIQYIPEQDLEKYLYSGAYVVAHVAISKYDFKADNNMRTWGVTAYLQDILFAKHGESLGGGGSNPEDAFADMEDFDDGSNDAANYAGGDDDFFGEPEETPGAEADPFS